MSEKKQQADPICPLLPHGRTIGREGGASPSRRAAECDLIFATPGDAPSTFDGSVGTLRPTTSLLAFAATIFVHVLLATFGRSQDAPAPAPVPAPTPATAQVLPSDDSSLVFSTAEWNEMEKAIDRGLVTLANEQNEDGSFGRAGSSQPAVTSLATMAFLSRGHQPGLGEHGTRINRAIDYVLASQDRFGFFVSGNSYNSSSTTYSHAIAGVMLAEVLGLTDRTRNERIVSGIDRGLEATMKLQHRHYNSKIDRGGWRYLKPQTGMSKSSDSDLSVTTWHMLFLRAAKNAGFEVPASLVKDCAEFVKRCHDAERNMFAYLPSRNGTITMTGAGVLCLNLAGEFADPAMLAGAETLQDFAFDMMDGGDRWPYYTCYHCSQAASQVGGEIRRDVLRNIAKFLLDEQNPQGSWPAMGTSRAYGEAYATSMAILSLTPAYQLLPIYQQ